jgi:hypothetical protein
MTNRDESELFEREYERSRADTERAIREPGGLAGLMREHYERHYQMLVECLTSDADPSPAVTLQLVKDLIRTRGKLGVK